jgi:methyl-accepting chemotaxis protein
MDQVIQGMAANAEESASAAEELSAQAQELTRMVEDLSNIVGLQSKTNYTSAQPTRPQSNARPLRSGASPVPHPATASANDSNLNRLAAVGQSRMLNPKEIIPLDNTELGNF